MVRYLESQPKISIKDLVDPRGYTLLHTACFKNYDEIAYELVMRAKRTLSDKELVEWINAKTEEDGFAALHFCSFRGNLTLIELLL